MPKLKLWNDFFSTKGHGEMQEQKLKALSNESPQPAPSISSRWLQ